MDGLYAYYHRQWWYRRQMFYHFKHCHGFLNGLALLVMALSVVVRAVWEDSLIMISLTAFETVVKGWNEHVSLCVHDVRKDLDRIGNICQGITVGRI